MSYYRQSLVASRLGASVYNPTVTTPVVNPLVNSYAPTVVRDVVHENMLNAENNRLNAVSV